MEFEFRKLIHYILFVILGVVIFKIVATGQIFKSEFHVGDGYKVRFPSGWVLDKGQSTKAGFFSTTYKPEQITYSTIELNSETKKPAASITMFSNKLDSAIWIADEFPTMLSQMKKQGLQIRQKGEIKVDKRINKWVLYKNPYNGTLNLEFLTVDDSNYLYKLSFVTYPPFFDKYRPDFEATKESLKYTRFSLEQ